MFLKFNLQIFGISIFLILLLNKTQPIIILPCFSKAPMVYFLLINIYNLIKKGGNSMAYKITDACVACGQCQSECPVEAISEGTPFVIDADKCVDCGACVSVCPTGAIEQG